MSRRQFVKTLIGGASVASFARVGTSGDQSSTVAGVTDLVPVYARLQTQRSRKQSSYDITGGNADAWRLKAGEEREVFAARGAGMITHIWFTIAAGPMHLKELGCGRIGTGLLSPASKYRSATSSG